MKRRINILKYAIGGTLFLTPFLFIIFLMEKNTYFNLKAQNATLIHNIEQEKIRSANLTLSFTQNQNHQKILDLHKHYAKDLNYIEASDIIQEKQIELL